MVLAQAAAGWVEWAECLRIDRTQLTFVIDIKKIKRLLVSGSLFFEF
jgi:hypothetical protein